MKEYTRTIGFTIALVAGIFALQQNGCIDVNPGPGPDPGPDPTPSEQYIDLPGVAVLIVRESAEVPMLPIEQQKVVHGYKWTEHVPNDQWRILDPDVEFTGESKYERAYAMAPPKVEGQAYDPWVCVSGPGIQYADSLPVNAQELIMKIEAAKK